MDNNKYTFWCHNVIFIISSTFDVLNMNYYQIAPEGIIFRKYYLLFIYIQASVLLHYKETMGITGVITITTACVNLPIH